MGKKTPELNTASMADISFLLLTFFLLTSSIDTDQGIVRKLPPPPTDDQKDIDVKQRNVLKVLVNRSDRLLVQGKLVDIRDLKILAKEFLANPGNREDLSEHETKTLDNLGPVNVSKGVISLKNDRGTSYDMYIQVQNELTAAVNELRDELSREKFGVKFTDLTRGEYKDAISKAVPVAISEAEPENIGGR
jgi:biopolymer transport protein ExbD